MLQVRTRGGRIWRQLLCGVRRLRHGPTATEFEIPSFKFHINLVGELNVRNALASLLAPNTAALLSPAFHPESFRGSGVCNRPPLKSNCFNSFPSNLGRSARSGIHPGISSPFHTHVSSSEINPRHLFWRIWGKHPIDNWSRHVMESAQAQRF